MSTDTDCPVADIDLWSDSALADPYPLWAELRALGPIVRLNPYGFYAAPRFASSRAVLASWQDFSSASGVMLNDETNKEQAGATLHSDPPQHTLLRKIISRPLTPSSLKAVCGTIHDEAEALADRLVGRVRFDGVVDLARYLPMTVVSRLVGLPESGRESMLAWAAAAFDYSGPPNDRARAALPVVREAFEYSFDPRLRERLDPDGWSAQLWRAAEAGEIDDTQCHTLLLDYWGPALDTTISAIAGAVWLFGRFPAQWRLLRDDPRLLSHAVNEVLRYESPTPYFSRVTTRDVELGDQRIPAGSRVLVMYGSANRDERKWDHPEVFDIRRNPTDHLAFGHGVHMCAGMHLGRMQLLAVLGALLPRVERFEVHSAEVLRNNMIRQLRRLDVSAHPASGHQAQRTST
ncbi:hypothetical protein ALI144C_32215 [Actinosynnema sp. ALI-1.44]|uniref:cytochrome P450 n=1 Tax=Actinosynnema sp. ALI-1.44 TaxID=1933779 RepID=UPI00097C3E63|nr:cytochrome P450 [Actinosynnema sp. ALI-1.44]ONI78049.1 hypothetical protein ALI144C_32215 [Actinosynnema sp. ALI-1.44]